jgi:hypothetical protein
MKQFVIEAYGGPQATNGSVRHFTVQAEDIDEAVALVRRSISGAKYARFDLIKEADRPETSSSGIVGEGEGRYTKAP